jgi:hypothetical protein
MKIKKIRTRLFISIIAIIVILIIILLFIYICSSQADSKTEQTEPDKHESIVPKKETKPEEIKTETEKKKPVARKQEKVITTEKDEAPQEKIFMIDVDAKKLWQDSGIVVTPGMRITISFEKGKWSIGGSPDTFTDGEGYRKLNLPRDYELITIGALIAKIGNNKTFKVGNYYEITESNMSGNLFFRINDERSHMFDNHGIITVKIIIY